MRVPLALPEFNIEEASLGKVGGCEWTQSCTTPMVTTLNAGVRGLDACFWGPRWGGRGVVQDFVHQPTQVCVLGLKSRVKSQMPCLVGGRVKCSGRSPQSYRNHVSFRSVAMPVVGWKKLSTEEIRLRASPREEGYPRCAFLGIEVFSEPRVDLRSFPQDCMTCSARIVGSGMISTVDA